MTKYSLNEKFSFAGDFFPHTDFLEIKVTLAGVVALRGHG
jgi:hypothetical protein